MLWYSTLRNHVTPIVRKGWQRGKGSDNEKQPGAHIVLADQIAAQDWMLLTHGGYFTEIHCDGSALCTWTRIDVGCKIWAFHDVKTTIPPTSRQDWWNEIDDMFAQYGNHEKYCPEGLVATVVLERGDLM
jgi:hypothetical protein